MINNEANCENGKSMALPDLGETGFGATIKCGNVSFLGREVIGSNPISSNK